MPTVFARDVSDRSFDYILVGGGTAGLVLAARLSEDPNTSVLVLEAGETHFGDPAVERPGNYGFHFGKSTYDWGFRTTPQKYSNGRQFNWERGKGLGGSSQINSWAWTIPKKDDIDDWERLGNDGWNWESLSKYLAKVTSCISPPSNHIGVCEHEHSKEGRDDVIEPPPKSLRQLKISHPQMLSHIDLQVRETYISMGIPMAPGPLDGNPSGVHLVHKTIDDAANTRSYSAQAYYIPNANRPNLSVLVSAYVTEIATASATEGQLKAEGVEFICEDITYRVHTNKEVILCAGAIKSPQILELSGIGRPEVLENIGVPVKLALEGVGENVQEHLVVATIFQLKDGIPDITYDIIHNPYAPIDQVIPLDNEQGTPVMGPINYVFQPLDALSPDAKSIHATACAHIGDKITAGHYSPGLVDQYRIQMKRFEEKGLGCEMLGYQGMLSTPNKRVPGKKYYTIVGIINHPFSRGTIHSVSKDPRADPEIDPRYFEQDIDLQYLTELVKFLRRMPLNTPLKDLVDSPVVELIPGPEVQSDDDIREWTKSTCVTTHHTAGSLSMLPRKMGGVVDSRLKVHGTTNIRVVDLSIVPLHFSAHTQSIVYAIAEIAADIIKGSI